MGTDSLTPFLATDEDIARARMHLQNRVMVRTGEDVMSLYWSVFTTLMLRCEERDKRIQQLELGWDRVEPDLAELEALRAGGVDNWERYHESTKHLYQDKE